MKISVSPVMANNGSFQSPPNSGEKTFKSFSAIDIVNDPNQFASLNKENMKKNTSSGGVYAFRYEFDNRTKRFAFAVERDMRIFTLKQYPFEDVSSVVVYQRKSLIDIFV